MDVKASVSSQRAQCLHVVQERVIVTLPTAPSSRLLLLPGLLRRHQRGGGPASTRVRRGAPCPFRDCPLHARRHKAGQRGIPLRALVLPHRRRGAHHCCSHRNALRPLGPHHLRLLHLRGRALRRRVHLLLCHHCALVLLLLHQVQHMRRRLKRRGKPHRRRQAGRSHHGPWRRHADAHEPGGRPSRWRQDDGGRCRRRSCCRHVSRRCGRRFCVGIAGSASRSGHRGHRRSVRSCNGRNMLGRLVWRRRRDGRQRDVERNRPCRLLLLLLRRLFPPLRRPRRRHAVGVQHRVVIHTVLRRAHSRRSCQRRRRQLLHAAVLAPLLLLLPLLASVTVVVVAAAEERDAVHHRRAGGSFSRTPLLILLQERGLVGVPTPSERAQVELFHTRRHAPAAVHAPFSSSAARCMPPPASSPGLPPPRRPP